jgi:hypothetical protein
VVQESGSITVEVRYIVPAPGTIPALFRVKEMSGVELFE